MRIPKYLNKLASVTMALAVTISGMGIMNLQVNADTDYSAVTLKEGNYTEFIDRLGDVPDCVTTFYETLEDNITESTDLLIDPTQSADTLSNGSYVIMIESISGSGKATITTDVATDVASAVVADVTEEYNKVAPYVMAAYHAFDRDHAEVFWLTGSCMVGQSYGYSYYTSGKYTYTQKIYFILQSSSFDVRDTDNYASASAIVSAIAQRDEYVEDILEGCTSTNRYEQLQYINSWLTTNNAYNSVVGGLESGTAKASAYECISALAGSTGKAGPVCEGYARAFKVLCDKLEIPCVLESGTSINSSGGSGAHMWNYVQMKDNNWYAMDVTWNDPIVNGSDTTGNENYFLVGADTVVSNMAFSKSHISTNQISTSGVAFTNGPVLANDAYVYTQEEEKGGDSTVTITNTVKAQVSEVANSKYHLRFVGGIENLDYDSVGFLVAIYDENLNVLSEEIEKSANHVYTSVKANGIRFTANELFGSDAGMNYLCTYTYRNMPAGSTYYFEVKNCNKLVGEDGYTTTYVSSSKWYKVTDGTIEAVEMTTGIGEN